VPEADIALNERRLCNNMEALGPTSSADFYRGTKQCAPKETRHGPESVMGLGVGHTSSQPLDDLRVWAYELATGKLISEILKDMGLRSAVFSS
jgi:hypothetical protein